MIAEFLIAAGVGFCVIGLGKALEQWLGDDDDNDGW